MENLLTRVKILDWDYRFNKWYCRWAEGYLNLVMMTDKGPKFAFAELAEGDFIYITAKDYAYKPVMHDGYMKETVGRYIGIYDKNNKKIFEGDIVRFHAFRDEPDWIGEVKYDTPNGLYVIVGTMPDSGAFEVSLSSKDKTTIEIIGNKWDNPELLEDLYK